MQRIEIDNVEKKRELFSKVANPQNWKLPTEEFVTSDREVAEEMRDAIVYFVGGAEVVTEQVLTRLHPTALVSVWMQYYRVSSKGYYHYIGA